MSEDERQERRGEGVDGSCFMFSIRRLSPWFLIQQLSLLELREGAGRSSRYSSEGGTEIPGKEGKGDFQVRSKRETTRRAE